MRRRKGDCILRDFGSWHRHNFASCLIYKSLRSTLLTRWCLPKPVFSTVNSLPIRFHQSLRALVVCFAILSSPLWADVPGSVQAFIHQNCLDCHQGSEAEAGLDLAKLSADFSDPEVLRHWVRVVDRVHAGEMPPQDAGVLEADVGNRFVSEAGSWIRQWQRAEHEELGRVRGRRLTKLQLERTLHDLLAIDLPLADLIPDEQRIDGFTGIAAGQSMSHFQLESHLKVVDEALDAGFQRLTDSPQTMEKHFTARQLARENPKRRCRDPEMIDGLAVTWSSRLTFYGRITATTVPESGWYRITFTASALNKPQTHGVWCTVRTGKCDSGAPLMSWIGAFEATDQPKQLSYEAWIPKGHRLEIRPGDATLKMARFAGGQVGAGEGAPQKVPGVAFHSMHMQRIHPGGDAATVQKRFFGDLDIDIDRNKKTIQLRSKEPVGDVSRQLRAFAYRAFRRPVDEETLKPFLQMLRRSIADGTDPIVALRGAYRAILCSPRFLYFTEKPGPLDDFAIASRLSYLLTGSMPDWQLLKLARKGRLRDQAELRGQVQRLLSGSRCRQFVKDFAAQWLDLDDIDFTEPDRKLYPDFDIIVQNSMLHETHRFLETLIQNDRPAKDLIDADFAFLNSRLSRFYKIGGAETDMLQRVSLDAKTHRGGLLAQGSILKVTANGTNTSPVLRGVWINERILGQPIPPPPANVPAIEPDVRGAKTVREMLEKHRSDTACASCHQMIDPPGFALENFDPAGRWREHYIQNRKRIPVDASYVLADGRKFETFEQFRQLIVADPEPIARNFAEKLLVYGTGAAVTFADREIVDQIVKATESKNYGLRSLIDAVASSSIFLNK